MDKGRNGAARVALALGATATSVFCNWWIGTLHPALDRPLIPFLTVAALGVFCPGRPVWTAFILAVLLTAARPLIPIVRPIAWEPALIHTGVLAAALGVVLYLHWKSGILARNLAEGDRRGALRFRTLMEASLEGVWGVDATGIVRYVNEPMATLLGYPREEMVGQSFLRFVPPDWHERARDALSHCIHGESSQAEFTFLQKDGGRVYTLVSTHPVLDSKGTLVEGFAIVRDITERERRAGDHLRALSLLEAAFESTADGLLVVDLAGNIVRTNERFARMWRIPPEVLESGYDDKAIESVLSQLEDPEAFVSKIRHLYATSDAESFDTLRFKDGRVFERYSLPQRVEGEVVGRVWSFRDVTERERAIAERQRAVDREAAIARNSDAALFTFRLGSENEIERFEYLSQGADALFGLPAEEIESDPSFWMRRVHSEDRDAAIRPAFARMRLLEPAQLEYRYEASRGIWRWHRLKLNPRRDADQRIHVDGIEIDVTDRVALEEQLRHAQKMDALGQLAGGVAHDFNNLLTVILGYADLVLRRLPETDPNRTALEEIRRGGERASALTRQLLAFGRRSATQPRVVELNSAIRGLEPMIRGLMGETVRFDFLLRDEVGNVRIDPMQLEQVLVNLVVNARDAMPEGGTLRIETDRFVEASSQSADEAGSRTFARIRVTDTGTGISPDVIDQIFEPFFTTKDVGRGTGLGLATVYGIVHQHGGRVQARSSPGDGTEFEILLPETSMPAVKAGQPRMALPTGSETVLLVEDNASLLVLGRDALTELGYTVHVAASGKEALRILEQEGERINLLVTDVVMPEMGGREVAERAARAHAALRVLYVSGYTHDETLLHRIEGATLHFLEKPYTPLSLGRKVREVLDAPVHPGVSPAASTS